jgi:uncharacterized membrane protein SirB2
LYMVLKQTHVTLVATSFLFFMMRFYWSLKHSNNLRRPWVKICPHIVDTLLLLSAIALVVTSRQFPLQQAWLTAKILALCCYIAFGSLAIKRAPTPRLKALFAVMAALTYAYIIAVAISKTAIPFG